MANYPKDWTERQSGQGRWSGAEGRHHQNFIGKPPLRRYDDVCECVKATCHGRMTATANDTVTCEACGLRIRDPRGKK